MNTRFFLMQWIAPVAAWLCLPVLNLHAVPPQVGMTAPDFELQGTDGRAHRLSDLTQGRIVVLAWFPKAFTGGCTAECKSIREESELLRAYQAAYFTISCDTLDLNRKFAESLDLDFPILSDPDQSVARQYGVVTPERKVPYRWTFFIGPERKILHIDQEVNTASHGRDVARKLKELDAPVKRQPNPPVESP